MERLDKFISTGTALTRSQAKAALKAGRITVDGVAERDGSRKIDPQGQVICLDGQSLNARCRVVLMLNKPAGYVTATTDPVERTVMELLPPGLDVKPVGRLDKATEGLLLFTNDGVLAHRLISPRSGVWKTYYAEHTGTAGEDDVAAFAAGMTLGDGTKCLPARLTPQGEGRSLIEVQEGKYHQVRRMMACRAMPVSYLKRVAEGSITLDGLEKGACRELPLSALAGVLDGGL